MDVDEEEDEVEDQRNGVRSELEALRSSGQVKNLFRYDSKVLTQLGPILFLSFLKRNCKYKIVIIISNCKVKFHLKLKILKVSNIKIIVFPDYSMADPIPVRCADP